MKYKCLYSTLVSLAVIFAFCFTDVLPAVGSPSIYRVDFEDGVGYGRYKDMVLSNVVNVTVFTSKRVTDVTVNGEQATGKKGDWIAYDVPLKPGKNTLTVVAEDSSGKETEKVDIYYLDSSIPGSKYTVTDLTESQKKLKLFGGAMQLNLPDLNAVMYNDKPANYQKVVFSVDKPNFKPTPDANYVSNIFSFTADYSKNCTLTEGGTLTLSYDSNVSDTEAYLLTVLYLEPGYINMGFSSPLVRNLGGVVDTGARSVTVSLPGKGFGAYVVVKKNGDFYDFYPQNGIQSSVAWSRPYVLTMWAKGIMSPLQNYADGSGVAPGYFGLLTNDHKEQVSVTRREMADILVKALRLPPVDWASLVTPTYSDLGELTLFERRPIETATRAGLFSGFPNQKGGLEFRPGNPVTRQQAALILARAAGAGLVNPTKATAIIKNYFKNDYQKIDEWMHPYVLAALQQGFFQLSEPGYFHPDRPFSRAEAARAVYILMKKKNYL